VHQGGCRMSTVTRPLEQHITAADTEVGLAVINRVLPTYARGLHAGDAAHLAHEAERVESLPPTPVANTMRAMVDAERTWRRHLARLGGRA
jgi:hypothetical protein